LVVDACTRRVVGSAMADRLRRELVLDVVGMALEHHHSDHGT
jgi:putative transposase